MLFRNQVKMALKGYNKKKFQGDLCAGVILAIMGIPMSIALSISSGTGPQAGLITSIILCLTTGLLGGSAAVIGGTNGSYVVTIAAIMALMGANGLAAATIVGGIIVIVAGYFNVGVLIKYLPATIITGFLSGTSLTIFAGEIKNFFGLDMGAVPGPMVEKIPAYIENFHTMDWTVLGLSVLTVVIIVIVGKFSKLIPGSLFALIIVTVVAQAFHMDVPTLGSMYPEFQGLTFRFQSFLVPADQWGSVITYGFIIAFLAIIETTIAAATADKISGDSHEPRPLLAAHGLGLVLSALFGGMPVGGAGIRTATGIQGGLTTTFGNLFHVAITLVAMLLLTPYLRLVPMAVFAGVLGVICYGMFDWRNYTRLRKMPKEDAVVFLATALITIFWSLIMAVVIGFVFAALFFIMKYEKTIKTKWERRGADWYCSVEGPLFFGNAKLFDQLKREAESGNVLFDLSKIPYMDMEGSNALYQYAKELEEQGRQVILTGVSEGGSDILFRNRLIDPAVFQTLEAKPQ